MSGAGAVSLLSVADAAQLPWASEVAAIAMPPFLTDRDESWLFADALLPVAQSPVRR
jgi:hypothetical protein